MDLTEKLAEVIESNSAGFVAQCYKLEQSPPLGALVKYCDDEEEIYGIVYSIETHSMEQGRRVAVRGEGMDTKDDIYRDNPQLVKLLATDFRVIVIGYQDSVGVHYYLPQNPVPIHGFIYHCQSEEYTKFTQSFDFLGLLVDSRLPVSVDEIIAAFLRFSSRHHADPTHFLISAGKELAWFLSGDTKRLTSILRRLQV
jgi:hypothetical protein